MDINQFAAHQRNILATMGVDLWVSRQQMDTQVFEYATYRDTAQAFVSTQALLDSAQTLAQLPATPIQTASIQTAQPQANAVLQSQVQIQNERTLIASQNARSAQHQLKQSKPESSSVDMAEADLTLAQNAPIEPNASGGEPALEIAAFELQAFVTEHYVLVLDSVDMTPDQAQLWSNIQAVQQGQYFELKWPFPLAQFQDGRGVLAYIHGFLNGLAQDNKVIALGVLPHIDGKAVLCSPTLQQMLDQPLLKRDLWQLMQNH